MPPKSDSDDESVTFEMALGAWESSDLDSESDADDASEDEQESEPGWELEPGQWVDEEGCVRDHWECSRDMALY